MAKEIESILAQIRSLAAYDKFRLLEAICEEYGLKPSEERE
jgi:hypothetical protein